jgi:hypothetical protein
MDAALVTLEVLDLVLVFLGRGAGLECPEIAAAASLGILLARVEAIFAGFELADHGFASSRLSAQ